LKRFILEYKKLLNTNINFIISDIFIFCDFYIDLFNENELESFKKRFPDYWSPDSVYEKSIEDLMSHIIGLQELIKEFEIHEFKIKDRAVRYFSSKDIKKMVK